MTRKPTEEQNVVDTAAIVIPGSVAGANVITGNVKQKSKYTTKQTPSAPTKKVVQRTSTRKRPLVDYSKLDKDLDVPSPPRKCHKPNLLRKPSKIVIAAHRKRKQMSPLGTSTGVKKNGYDDCGSNTVYQQ